MREVQIIKSLRGSDLDDLNEKIVKSQVKRRDIIKHNFFFVNSHDSVHEVLYWSEDC